MLIEACEHCYATLNPNPKNITNVCVQQHPLVWAKVIGFPYEPAKAMNIQNNTVTVLFFTDHKIANIPPKFCLAFSEKSPNQNNYSVGPYILQVNRLNISTFRFVSLISEKHLSSQEVKEYIKNLGPAFKYAPCNELFDISTIKSRFTNAAKPIWAPNIRKTVNELLDRNEEEFEFLKLDFANKETEYQKKIVDLETEIVMQKRKHEEMVQSIKLKKWCECCAKETKTATPHFCSNSCGAKW